MQCKCVRTNCQECWTQTTECTVKEEVHSPVSSSPKPLNPCCSSQPFALHHHSFFKRLQKSPQMRSANPQQATVEFQQRDAPENLPSDAFQAQNVRLESQVVQIKALPQTLANNQVRPFPAQFWAGQHKGSPCPKTQRNCSFKKSQVSKWYSYNDFFELLKAMQNLEIQFEDIKQRV